MLAPRLGSGATRPTSARSAVHRRPGAPVPAQGAPALVGGGRGDARRHHRLPDAPRLAAEHAPGRRPGAGVGRVRRPRHWAIQLAVAAGADRWPSCPTTRGASTARSSAPSATSTAGGPAGAWRRTGRTPTARSGPALPGVRGQGLGGAGRAPQPDHRLRASREATIPTSIFVCEAAAWSWSAPGRPGTARSSTSATTGCSRSGCRDRTNDEQARAYNDLVVRVVDPCLGKLYHFEEIPTPTTRWSGASTCSATGWRWSAPAGRPGEEVMDGGYLGLPVAADEASRTAGSSPRWPSIPGTSPGLRRPAAHLRAAARRGPGVRKGLLMGVTKGSKVAVMLANRPEFVVAAYGATLMAWSPCP